MRRRYLIGGGSYGINLKLAKLPHLILFLSDTDRYEDQVWDSDLLYEWQNQITNKNGATKASPKPPLQFGPVGRNLSVVNALRSNGGILPVILIAREGPNLWAEKYSDCFCSGTYVAADGVHYFRIKRSRLPRWLLSGNPDVSEVDEVDEE